MVGVGTREVADDGQVEVVQRAADGQRVILRVVAVDVEGFVAGNDARVAPFHTQTQFVGQSAWFGEVDYFVHAVAVVTDDIFSIFAPSLLISVNLAGWYVNLHAVVLGEGTAAQRSWSCATHHDCLKAACAEGIILDHRYGGG